MTHMKYAILPTLALLMSISASAADLKINISNFHNEKGLVRITVFSDNGAFYKDTDHAAAKLSLPVAQAKSFTVPRLAPGTYAIAVIHDENSNGKLDTNILGMPKEGYGFSNSNGIMPPSFQKASFALPSNGATVEIKLKHL
jgi:uncharacterized protein (DUF2141 family)